MPLSTGRLVQTPDPTNLMGRDRIPQRPALTFNLIRSLQTQVLDPLRLHSPRRVELALTPFNHQSHTQLLRGYRRGYASILLSPQVSRI